MLLQRLTNNLTGKVRKEKLQGRDYLVVPMVMLTEGVHNGSNGPLYYPSDELTKTPVVWNHKPIVVYHPESNGQGISACAPEVLEKQSVGIVLNTRAVRDRKGKRLAKLRAEAWLDEARIDEVDPRIREHLNANKVMEVSTGVFTDNVGPEGEWNGEKYVAVARNYRPDHLALLPDKVGACSVAKGAGLLQLNEQRLINLMDLRGLVANEMSHSQISTGLSMALREKLGEKWTGWIEDIFDGSVVYWDDGKLCRIKYVADNGTVDLAGDHEYVERRVSYEVVSGPAYNEEQPTENKWSAAARKAASQSRKMRAGRAIKDKASSVGRVGRAKKAAALKQYLKVAGKKARKSMRKDYLTA